MSKPLITAHSGCMDTRPNSVTSVMEGLNAGADVIEVDIRVTRDGKVVLHHDEEVRTNAEFKRLRDLTYVELKHIMKEGNIYLLDEVLPLIKERHRMINLDVKDLDVIDPLIQTVEKHKMRDSAIFSGCEKETAIYVKTFYSPYQVLLNANASHFLKGEEDYKAFVKKTIEDAIICSCCGINVNYQLCREDFIEPARLRGLPTSVWTVDELDMMNRFIEMDVHSITTNEVTTLVGLRNKRKG
ncbi:hypothetical protein F0342_03540 [Bacillus sp. CH30_1T]|uniref:glycerophosphodiester phosphodiesterase n=1 Tax=Bacillus sp. CH30_1T TaxID=2604836 RepID=UPI0012597321|nr:glycerophosphodiester phosphodiesterase family protein [Bacillus sp. CH30_1T]KAA0565776.1 hypothetical protein F0342_03540 [Bacillus sp. CH30_1T]